MVVPIRFTQILEDSQLFWNEYVQSIPQVQVDEAKVRSFVELVQCALKGHTTGYEGLAIKKRGSFWILSRFDTPSLGKIHERLFESSIRPALSHFAYLYQARLEVRPDDVRLSVFNPCASDPRFQDKRAFWCAYLSIMKQKGLIIDDSLLPCIERIYIELFAAKHVNGTIYFEQRDEVYVLWDAYNYPIGSLPFDMYEQYIKTALRGFCEISKARLTQMEAGDFLSFASMV